MLVTPPVPDVRYNYIHMSVEMQRSFRGRTIDGVPSLDEKEHEICISALCLSCIFVHVDTTSKIKTIIESASRHGITICSILFMDGMNIDMIVRTDSIDKLRSFIEELKNIDNKLGAEYKENNGKITARILISLI